MARVTGKKLVVACLSVVLVLVIFLGVLITNSVRGILRAERRLQSMITMEQVLVEFLELHNPPRWPGSWDELEASGIRVDDHWPMWPEDRELIEKDLIIEFSISLDQVSLPEGNEAGAIRPSETPYFVWEFWALRDAVEKHRLDSSDEQDSP